MSNIGELRDLMQTYSIRELAKYLDISESTISRWTKIPSKYSKRVVEFIEIKNDDMVDFCCRLTKDAREYEQNKEARLKQLKKEQNRRAYERRKAFIS